MNMEAIPGGKKPLAFDHNFEKELASLLAGKHPRNESGLGELQAETLFRKIVGAYGREIDSAEEKEKVLAHIKSLEEDPTIHKNDIFGVLEAEYGHLSTDERYAEDEMHVERSESDGEAAA